MKNSFISREGNKNIARLLNYSSSHKRGFDRSGMRRIKVRRNRVILIISAIIVLIIGFIGIL